MASAKRGSKKSRRGTRTVPPSGALYLVKANNKLISHCRCKLAPASLFHQMDCPWCGCGWLWTCLKCQKAFTFARAVQRPRPLEEIVGLMVEAQGEEATPRQIKKWAAAVTEMTGSLEEGREYVYFDGNIVDVRAKEIGYTGFAAKHDLPFVPQVRALRDPKVGRHILENEAYWRGEFKPSFG